MGRTMNITEADRIDMLAELRRCHGDRVGDIIVQHLPPTGWGDVARITDINRLERRIDRLTTVVTWMGGVFVACFLGLFSLIATKL